MWVVLSLLGVAFVSAFVPVLNIETYVVVVSASGQLSPLVVAATAAVGQVCGKLLWYEVGRTSTRWPWLQRKLARPSISTRLDRWSVWVTDHPRWTVLMLLTSASAGLPPFMIISVVAGRLRVSLPLFVVTALVGRFVRFLLASGLVEQLAPRFG